MFLLLQLTPHLEEQRNNYCMNEKIMRNEKMQNRLNRKVNHPCHLWFQQSSAVFIHQARTVNATVGDATGPDQHAMAG